MAFAVTTTSLDEAMRAGMTSMPPTLASLRPRADYRNMSALTAKLVVEPKSPPRLLRRSLLLDANSPFLFG